MDRNRIRYIAPTAFVGMSNLLQLRLDDNGLQTLSARLLEPLLSIRIINASNNRLTHVLQDYDGSLGNGNTIECRKKGEWMHTLAGIFCVNVWKLYWMGEIVSIIVQ